MPNSSANTERLTSKREDSHRHSPRSPSSHSLAIFDFFERPLSTKASYGPAHRSFRNPQTTFVQKRLAMPTQGQVRIDLQMGRQPLPQGLALHGGSSGDLVDVDLPCKAPPIRSALDGGAEDSEEFLDLPSWDATVDSDKRLQSEVLRVCVHGEAFSYSFPGSLIIPCDSPTCPPGFDSSGPGRSHKHSILTMP